MTWTYDNNPGDGTAAERRDSVRLFVGDTDTTDQQVTDEEIAFALSQTSDNIYSAAAIIARSIAAQYSRQVTSSVESVRIAASDLHKHYLDLASRMEGQSKKYGSGGLGVPLVGGISESEMESVRDDEDRVKPAFSTDQFRNPPKNSDDYDTYE